MTLTRRVLVGTLAAAAALVVYRDVLHAYFWNDDFGWLYLLANADLTEVLLTPLGGHMLVGRNAVFAALYHLAGMDPRPYFVSVLLTHGVNVLLLYRLVFLLTGSVTIAGVGAVAWGTCPAASESLAWYSVYGHVAATTCVLLALCRVVRRARCGETLSRVDLLAVAALLTLASSFFGTAIAVALLLPAAAALLFGRLIAWTDLRWLIAVSAVVLALYGTLQLVAWSVYAVPAVPAFLLRSLVQRSSAALAAFVELLRVGVTAVVLGAWWSPSGGPDAASWAASAFVLAAWVIAVASAPPGPRSSLLAFTLLALGTYALIAVARGPSGVSLWNLTAAQVGATLRYHYGAQALLVAALCLVLAVLGARLPARGRAGVALGWLALLVAGQLRHGVAIDLHAEHRAEIAGLLADMQRQAAAAPPGDVVYLDNHPVRAFGWVPNTFERPPGLAALFVIVSPSDEIGGRRVRFIEQDPRVYDRFAAPGRGRIARVLTPATIRPAPRATR